MNGVEILSSTIIYNTILPAWCSVVGFILMITFFAVNMLKSNEENCVATIILFVLMIGSIVLAILGSVSDTNSIKYIEHKVTIDDSVSMNEFLDKYEILDQEGKIYTVKEKTND